MAFHGGHALFALGTWWLWGPGATVAALARDTLALVLLRRSAADAVAARVGAAVEWLQGIFASQRRRELHVCTEGWSMRAPGIGGPELRGSLLRLNGFSVGRIREGRQVRRALCLAVGGAHVFFGEGLGQAEAEVLADRLNGHLARVTGLAPSPSVPNDSARAGGGGGSLRYEALAAEFPGVQSMDFDEVLDGVSAFQPFFNVTVDADGWWQDMLQRNKGSGGLP